MRQAEYFLNKESSYDDYKRYLFKEHKLGDEATYKNYYESVTNRMLQAVEESDFWKTFSDSLESLNLEFVASTKYSLFFASSVKVKLLPYSSGEIKGSQPSLRLRCFTAKH
jgi:hypothetical protein